MDGGGRSNGTHPFDTGDRYAGNDVSSLRVPLNGTGCIDDHAEGMKCATELTFATGRDRSGEKGYYGRWMRCDHRKGWGWC